MFLWGGGGSAVSDLNLTICYLYYDNLLLLFKSDMKKWLLNLRFGSAVGSVG